MTGDRHDPGTPRVIAVTGASKGLGAALAVSFARAGRRLYLCARSASDLAEVAERCRASGSEVDLAVFDVGDAGSVASWVDRIDTAAPIDLMIVNAGIFDGRRQGALVEEPAIAVPIIQTNLTGAILCAGAMAQKMAARQEGQIVLISSLAGSLPGADAMAYSASKAGVTAYGVALREAMAENDVTVTIIEPGHIQTAQTDGHRGALPFLLSPEHAANKIRRKIDTRASWAAVPRRAGVAVFLANLLPWKLRAFLGRSARFSVDETR